MKLYLTGADGMVGTALTEALAANPSTEDWTVRGVSVKDFDIADPQPVHASIAEFAPDIVVHAAAIAIVDTCETKPGRAIRVNVAGTYNVAQVCRRHGARLVYLSSDYVFDGAHPPPAEYSETDVPCPVSVYGLTKLAGEHITATVPDHLIIRTSWLFGGTDESTDLVLATIRQAQRGQRPRLIDDQRSGPTYTLDLADTIVELLDRGVTGTVHVANGGAATWYQVGEFALAVVDAGLAGACPPIGVALRDCGFRGARPHNSTLHTGRLADLGLALPHWSDAVARYTATLVPRPAVVA
jgi:dTDP-4-dehydrorhamnose reductase